MIRTEYTWQRAEIEGIKGNKGHEHEEGDCVLKNVIGVQRNYCIMNYYVRNHFNYLYK